MVPILLYDYFKCPVNYRSKYNKINKSQRIYIKNVRKYIFNIRPLYEICALAVIDSSLY